MIKAWLLSLLVVSTVASADPRVHLPALQSPTCRKILYRSIVGISSALVAGMGFLYFNSDEFVAHREGRRHLGFGINYRPRDVWEAMSAEQRRFVSEHRGDTRADRLALAQFFNQMFYGDYDFHLALDTTGELESYGGRSVTEFMAGHSTRRGVCRHKALILESVLRDFGVSAVAMCGTAVSRGEVIHHAWVEIPDDDIAIDSTRPWVGTRRDFYRYRSVDVASLERYRKQTRYFGDRIPYDAEVMERTPFPAGYPPVGYSANEP